MKTIDKQIVWIEIQFFNFGRIHFVVESEKYDDKDQRPDQRGPINDSRIRAEHIKTGCVWFELEKGLQPVHISQPDDPQVDEGEQDHTRHQNKALALLGQSLRQVNVTLCWLHQKAW